MRDLLVTLIVFGSLPLILARPFVGILMWSWISYMNPHRLSWGFAFDMPFAQIVAVATVLGLIFSNESKRVPMRTMTILWATFLVWMMVTTIFALEPAEARAQLTKILKIQLFVLLTMMLVRSRERIEQLVWVIVLSIGFFGVKGGIFTLMTGGENRVYGPPGGFIAENNALAIATLMTIPLMHFLRLQATNRWIRLGLLAAMVLSVTAVLGSHSRGAIVAGSVFLVLFWLKSHRKLLTAFALAILVPPLVLFMPQNWADRVDTISDESATIADITSMRTRSGDGMLSAPIASRDRLGYWPKDFSSLGRVNAWNYAINVASSRVTGAGLESWNEANFRRFAPIVEEVQAAHSIFFSILADHGWIGLFLFLAILVVVWRNASWTVARSRAEPELRWAGDLSRMLQLSIIAYAVGGAFLSLAYYDMPWQLFAIAMLCRLLAEGRLEAPEMGDARRPHLNGPGATSSGRWRPGTARTSLSNRRSDRFAD